MLICSIYDYKSKNYGLPLVFQNEHEAIRSFANAACDRKSNVSRFPNDYALFSLAMFDEKSGRFTSFEQPVHLSNAVEHVNLMPIDEALISSISDLAIQMSNSVNEVRNLIHQEKLDAIKAIPSPDISSKKKNRWF